MVLWPSPVFFYLSLSLSLYLFLFLFLFLCKNTSSGSCGGEEHSAHSAHRAGNVRPNASNARGAGEPPLGQA